MNTPLFKQFCQDARYYKRPLLNGHHYAVRTPSGVFLAAKDTDSLFKLYERAIKREAEDPT